MLNRSILLILFLCLLVLIASCREEAVVEQNQEINTAVQSTLAKKSDLSSVLADSIIQKEKKEKVKRLKKEHEKPFVVIEKPEKLLIEKLKARASGKASSNIIEKNKLRSLQSVQSCEIMQIDVWALEKYHSKSGFNVGIRPKDWWKTSNSILTTLKEFWAFNKIMMFRPEIDNQTVYAHNQIVGDVNPLHPYWAKTDYMNLQPRDLYGFYMDEPAHSLDPHMRDSVSKLVSDLKGLGFTSSIYMAGETCDILAQKVDDLVDVINMSGYTDYFYNFLVGCMPDPTDDDQRDVWSEYDNSFGNKFNHLWISGEKDRTEMDPLTGYAQNHGKNSIWFYGGQYHHSDDDYWYEISEFCYYSFVHNYLRREERKFIYVYYYVGDGDPCSDYQITSWDLVDIIDSGETRIL